MESSKDTIQIFIDKDLDLYDLYKELLELRGHRFPGIKEFFLNYPKVADLMSLLKNELEK